MPRGMKGSKRPYLLQPRGSAMTPEAFAAYRHLWGYTQPEFGAVLGYNTQSISDMENDRRAIVTRTLYHLLDLEFRRKYPQAWREMERVRLAQLREAIVIPDVRVSAQA